MSDITQSKFDYSALDQDTRSFVQYKARDIRKNLRNSANEIIIAGQRLTEVKARLPHGQFGIWLQAEFQMSDRQARKFMEVAERFQGKAEIISDLPATVVYLLASPSTPDAVVDAVVEGTLEPTIDAIKEAKEAQRKAEEKVVDTEQQLTLLTQLSQDKVNELTEQIKSLETQIKTISTPETVEVVPQTVLDDIQRLKSDLEQRTQQRDTLSEALQKEMKELDDIRYANKEVRERQTYVSGIRGKWKEATNNLHGHLKQFVFSMPKDADIPVFEGDEWGMVSSALKEVEHILDMLIELQSKQHKIVASDNTVDTSIVLSS